MASFLTTESTKEAEFMPKKPTKKNAVLAAHASEQMEGHARTFLLNLEHYGISGVLYLKMPNDEDNIMVFSSSNREEAYIKLLQRSTACSQAGAKAILDKQK